MNGDHDELEKLLRRFRREHFLDLVSSVVITVACLAAIAVMLWLVNLI